MAARRALACALVLVFGVAADALGQAARAIVQENAPIVLLPDATRQPLRVAAPGTSLVLVKEEGSWLQVQFQDPQFGLRTGYIQTKSVRIQRAGLEPLNLSVAADTSMLPSSGPPRSSAAAAVSARQSSSVERRIPGRLFVDVSWASFRPRQESYSSASTRRLFSETATASAAYPTLPSIRGVLSGVSVAFDSHVGIGARLLFPRYTGLAATAIAIPHPLFFNRYAGDVSLFAFDRKDIVIDVPVSYTYNTAKWRVVGLGGPTFFHVSQDMVGQINYNQLYTVFGANAVTITTTDQRRVSESGYGFNVGGDVSYFAWRHVGFGGGVHFNRGTVNIIDPLSGDQADLRVGSTTFVAGARFRF